jgi:hypothetical protein
MAATSRAGEQRRPRRGRWVPIAALAGLGLTAACATQSLRYEDWLRVETVHFEILSALPHEDTQRLAGDLEVFRRSLAFVVDRELANPASRIRVFAFNGRSLLRPFDRRTVSGYLATSLAGPTVVLRAGGGFRDDATPELRRDLASLLLEGSVNSGRPLWYDRGIADLFSTLSIADQSVRVGAPRKDLLRLIRERPWTPMESHLRVGDLADHGKRGREEFDAQSWLLVHYLLLGAQNRDSVQVWLGRVLRAEPYEAEALLRGLGGGRPLDGALADYQQRGRFPSISLRIEAAPEGAVRASRTLTEDEVGVELGALSLQLARPRQARGYFGGVLARTPDQPDALAGRVLAEAMDGRFDALPPALTAALATERAGARVHRWLGRARLLEAGATRDAKSRAALAASARNHAVKAVRLAPDLGGPGALFAATYVVEGEDAEEGLEAVARAAKRMPGSSDVQLVHARLLAQLRRVAAARELAAGVLSRASESSLRREAKQLVESLGVTRLQ